jgi:hypothetical protein
MTITRSEALVGARDWLQNHSWSKGTYGNQGFSACLMGAVHEIIAPELRHGAVDYKDESTQELDIELRHLLVNTAQKLYPFRPVGSVEAFNDHMDTTYDDVLAVLDAAIEKELCPA